jgi:cysteine-S-conjugate beta-lyase
MDFKNASFIIDDIKKKLNEELFGYPEPNDKDFIAIKNWMQKQHLWKIDKNHIVLSNGVVGSISACIEAFSNKDDEIIIQPPVYYPFFDTVIQNNRKLIQNHLINDNGYYKMDLKDLEKKITKKTKLLILCSPHNPVGRVYTKDELEKLANICIKNNILIISDEIHCDIVYDKFTPLASINENIANITITLNSPSKTFNIAGLTTSYAIISNQNLREKYKKIAKKREITSLNTFGLVAMRSAYEKGDIWLKQLLDYLKSNIEFTKKYLEKHTKIKFKNPQCTYLLWLDFSEYNLSNRQIEKILLKKAKVALNNGKTFDQNSQSYFRLNIALNKTKLQEALIKISQNF